MPSPTALRRPLRAAVTALVALLACAAPAAADGEPAAAPPPAVAFTAPTAGGTVGAGVPTTLTAVAAGDIRLLSIHVDGRPVCVFTRVHDAYACPWTPQVTDVGAHTVEARVQAGDGQPATASLRLTVGRLLPSGVGATTRRALVAGGGLRLTTHGTVAVPAGLTAEACTGTATVTVLARGHTIVDRSVPVAADCRFASRVTFSAPPGARALRVKVAFGGARLLAPKAAPTQTIRLR